MGRGELRRDRCMVLVQTGHIRSAGTGEAKPRMRKRYVQALDLSAGLDRLIEYATQNNRGII